MNGFELRWYSYTWGSQVGSTLLVEDQILLLVRFSQTHAGNDPGAMHVRFVVALGCQETIRDRTQKINSLDLDFGAIFVAPLRQFQLAGVGAGADNLVEVGADEVRHGV